MNLEPFSHHSLFRTTLRTKTQIVFATPSWEAWADTPTGLVQLIGGQRQLILWANALIPFFLAYAREENYHWLESLIYKIFMVLPADGSNQKIRFMEKRLGLSNKSKMGRNSLKSQQGLIQIYHDFCHSFYQGCEQCELIGLIGNRGSQETR